MNERLQTLIADILGMHSGDVVLDLARADTEQWDSLNHLRLVTAFEEEFGVRLTMDQIAQVQSPRHLEEIIEQRGGAHG